MSTTEQKLVALLQRLLEQTAEGEISWEETAARDFYQVAFPSYTVQIGEREEESGTLDFVLRIFNKDNQLMEEAGAGDLRSELDNAYNQMRQLYTAARRKAMEVDEALDNILSSLGEKAK